MKQLAVIIMTLCTVASLNAAQYKNALEEPPAPDSPVGVYLQFQKAAAAGDVDTMRSVSTGQIRSTLESEEAIEEHTARAKDIDWNKPVMWADKIEGDSAKIGLRYKRISDGRTFNVKLYCMRVDGEWKFSGNKN